MGRVQFKALPLDLREQDARVLNHGVPVPASPAIADRIVLVSTKSVRHLILGLFLIQ